MARQSRKRESRAKRRREELAIKLLVIGGALALAPLLLRNSILGKAFTALIPIGLLMVAAGAVLLWLERRAASTGAEQADPFGLRAAGRQEPHLRRDHTPPPVDRTATELERASRIEPSFATPRRAPTTWGPQVFDVIEWRRFEAFVEALFQQAGFETRSQSHGADEGIDVWLYSRSQPGAPVSIVQCKHWSGKQVGVDKIRELRGVMASKDIRRGQFATTSTFTPAAIAFARDNGINLLDVDGLLALIEKRTPEQREALLAVALDGDYWRPTCVNCGIKMVDRAPRKGGNAFWGCVNYPRCQTTMPMRSA